MLTSSIALPSMQMRGFWSSWDLLSDWWDWMTWIGFNCYLSSIVYLDGGMWLYQMRPSGKIKDSHGYQTVRTQVCTSPETPGKSDWETQGCSTPQYLSHCVMVVLRPVYIYMYSRTCSKLHLYIRSTFFIVPGYVCMGINLSISSTCLKAPLMTGPNGGCIDMFDCVYVAVDY